MGGRITANSMRDKVVFTVGHSTRHLNDFSLLMRENKIREVIDIRIIPKSRHNPQFNSDHLKKALIKNHILYKNMKELGGLRKPTKNSINTFWKNSSFKGFADYMQTDDFERGLNRLIDATTRRTVAIMCAEIVPWRCHRSLIADALTAIGFTVKDIIDHDNIIEHKMNKHAIRYSGSLVYK
ncbi:MAG: DUF488 family protein [Candidatus Acidifodinimicrobium sp.]